MHGNSWYRQVECGFIGNSGFGGWHYLMMLGIIIIVVAMILFIRRKNNSNGNQALDILKELYVKGDISEEEYLKRKNVIER